MEFRTMPRTGAQVGVIGMGSAVVGAQDEADIIATVRAALDAGVNYFDMAGGHASIFSAYGKALAGVRERVMLQIHFGADYTSGEYGWTTALDRIKASVAWQLAQLGTDYIDIGFIHCMDEAGDFDTYCANGVLDYILSLKEKGIVRQIGLSSHTPHVAERILDTGIVDVLMFSINPLYDSGKGEYGFGQSEERHALYRRCAKDGIGIVVMKPFCGGQLLDGAKSPFGVALSEAQCIRYALDKPGVLCVVPGFGNVDEVVRTMGYFAADDAACDYAILGELNPDAAAGRCVYCRHCHPCPAGLDIGLINKYYDLAMLGDNLAREHYMSLTRRAGDCIGCGHCDSRCPFGVAQSARMAAIAAEFGA